MGLNEEAVAKVDRVVAAASDDLVAWLRANVPDTDAAAGVHLALVEAMGEGDHDAVLRRITAYNLYRLAELRVFPAPEPDPDEAPDPSDGYRLLADGRLVEALAFAERLEDALGATDLDEWDRAKLAHHLHVLRGKVRLARGDVAGAASELQLAGTAPGSPEPDSIDPDLTLAWDLLRAGRDADVLAYFRSIAAFWSPMAP